MRLSIYSACTPSLTPLKLLETAALYGYAGIEWRISDEPVVGETPHFLHHNLCTVSPDNSAIDEICAATKQAGLETTVLSPYIKPGDIDALDHFHSAAVRNNVPVIRLRASWMDERGYHALVQQDLSFLEAAAKISANSPVTFAVETHQRSIAPSASLADRLLSNFKTTEIGVIYDIGNLVAEGYEDPEISLALILDRIVSIHLKNAYYERSLNTANSWELRWCELEAGILNIPHFLECLNRFGYNGWLSIEDFSTDVTDSIKLARAATYLEPFLSSYKSLNPVNN